MKRWLLLVLGLSSLGAARMEGRTPSHIYDKQADFSHYRTYQWARFPNALNLGELTEGQLKGTLQLALAGKG